MWKVEVDFSVQYGEGEEWEDEDGLSFSRSFRDEADARAFWLEARAVSKDWLDDEEGIRPGPSAIEFVRTHNFTVFDVEGTPCGGFLDGKPVPGMAIAPSMVLSAVYVRDVLEEWIASLPMGDHR
jgi:hypothetical protein